MEHQPDTSRRYGRRLVGIDVEASHYGPRLSALVGLLGMWMSSGAIARVRQRLSAVLEQLMREVLDFARQQPVAYVDETGAPTGKALLESGAGSESWSPLW